MTEFEAILREAGTCSHQALARVNEVQVVQNNGFAPKCCTRLENNTNVFRTKYKLSLYFAPIVCASHVAHQESFLLVVHVAYCARVRSCKIGRAR